MEQPHQNGDLERHLSSEASGLLSTHSGISGNARAEHRKSRPTSAGSRSSANLSGGRRRSPKSGCPGIIDPHEIRSAGSAAVDSVTSIARVLCSGDLDEVSHQVAERLTNIEDRVFFRHGGGPATPVAREQFITASVPLLHDVQLELDDKDAAVVMVFPRKPPDRSSSASGLVEIDGEMHVAKPGEMLQKAFLERAEHMCPHAQKIVDDSRAGNDEPILARAYGRIVREEIVNVLADQGFQIKTRESIDKEEVFALVYLPRDGAAIKRMARTYSYRLPVNQFAYEHVSEPIMENAWGEKVPAYMAYEEGLEKYLEPFSHRDEVLIAKRRLDELLNFNELKSQGVMTKHFAATKYEDVMRLHKSWSKLRRLCLPPSFDSGSGSPRPRGFLPCGTTPDVLNDVRDYYGEEVAFFYMWLARFIRWLMPLAIIGLVALAIRRHPAWAPHISQKQDHQIRLTFACVMVLWASLVNKFWTRVAARMRQQWGLTGEATVQTWSRVPSYKPHMDGTYYGAFRSHISYLCPVLYCSVFIFIVMQVQPHLNDMHSTFQKYLPSLGIFLFGNLWSRNVGKVVDMQNHEMQARWNDALTWFLAPVKLIITVWPFLNLMFVKKWSDSKTFEKDSPEYLEMLGGMQQVFKRSDAGCRLIGQNISTLVEFLSQQDYVNWEGKKATFYGCLPVECWVRHPGERFETSPCFPETACDLEVRLTTDCLQQLESQLFAFYVTHFSIMLVLIMWPIILARFTMKNAIIKENMKAGMTTRRYSLIQFQAKCFDLAPYEYWSWGGSWVENFMEPAIVFTHLQCFALIAPILSALAFVTLVLEYRLMAYRHNNMTCRNWPYAAPGIGAWSLILKCSSYMAVFCIVCKVTLLDDEEKLFDYEFDMAKIEGKIGLDMNKQGDYKLGNFILMQVVMLGIQAGVGLVIPDDPDDVERIGNFNAHVKTKLLKEQELELKQVHASEMGTNVLSSEFVSIAKNGLVAGLDSASEGEDSALSAGQTSREDSGSVSDGASSTDVQESTELVEQRGCFGARALR